MQQITIRFATAEDAATIADLSRATFYNTFAEHNTVHDMEKFMNEQFTRSKLIAQVTEPGNIFFIAEAGEEIAGYVRMLEGHNPAALGNIPAIEIARIYSVSTQIGKGVGSALMQRCIDFALKQDKQIIWLGVWEKNQRAIDFYQKWGFEKFGEHDFTLGDDVQRDWLMQKIL